MIQAEREQIDNIMQNSNKRIWVTFTREGLHRYPDAESNPSLTDVNFLAYPHRHIFHFKVNLEVFHNDRELEFIQVKRWLENLYSTNTLQLDYKSCEMIADDLYLQIAQKYPNRNVWIEVSEDGENGCYIEYLK